MALIVPLSTLLIDVFEKAKIPRKNTFFLKFMFEPRQYKNNALRCDFKAGKRNSRAYLSNKTNRCKKSILVGEWQILKNGSIWGPTSATVPLNATVARGFWIGFK